jgi:hypothetical protein
MKKIEVFPIFFILSLFLFFQSCSKDEREIKINLYAAQPLTLENEEFAGEEIISLLEPILCQESKIAVRPNLVIHRLDIENAEPQTVSFPLSKAGEMRRKLNFLSFKHYVQEFKENGAKAPNTNYLYQEGTLSAEESSFELNGDGIWYCCGETSNRQYSSMESLILALNDTLCQPSFNDLSIDIFYNPDKGSFKSINVGKSTDVAEVLNILGNADEPPVDRFNRVEDYLSMFSNDADVKILGQVSGKIIDEPIAIKDYMERIAMFKSLDRIEVVEALKNDDGKIWEVRLIEHHN